MDVNQKLPIDVHLAVYDWLEMCRAARDEPSAAEVKEYIRLLMKARKELDSEGKSQ